MLRKKVGTSPLEALAAAFVPIRIIEVELGQPLPAVVSVNEQTGQRYGRALCLVRLHTQPLGVVEFPLDEAGLGAGQYAQHIWAGLSAQINAHLRQDGLAPVTGLDEAGLPAAQTPLCLEERARFLAQAPFVSVIVATRDRPERIQTCLRSLLSLDYPHYEVLVVDNAPTTTATAEFIQQTYRDVPQVRYLREDRAGKSWALNCGMHAARGEILAFTDDDVVVDRSWLVELVRGFSLSEDVACVTEVVFPLELETPAQLWFEGYVRSGWTDDFTRRISDKVKPYEYLYRINKFTAGASMAFRPTFLRSVGGFDPALGPASAARSGEDHAILFQLIMAGYRLVHQPTALLYHQNRRDYASLRNQIYGYEVGFTAYLTKSAFDHPQLLLDLVTKVPHGLYFIFSPRSPKNIKMSTHYPKELTRVAQKGMLYGPLAYVRSRWALRHARQAFALPPDSHVASTEQAYSPPTLEQT